MKNGYTVGAMVALAGLATAAQANLIISEVVDGTLTGGVPKFVELTNTGNTSIDLSAYSIGNYNNGSTTLGGSASLVLSGMLAAGDSYVISYENSDSPGVGAFFDTYGFDPDNFDLGAFVNGDDVLALFQGPATDDGSDATLVDVYGVIGVDGTGEVWEYTDGYSFRSFNTVSGSSTFTPGEWNFGGVDSLEGADAAASTDLLLANTTPGTHSFVPAPGGAALLGLSGLVAMRRRRH